MFFNEEDAFFLLCALLSPERQYRLDLVYQHLETTARFETIFILIRRFCRQLRLNLDSAKVSPLYTMQHHDYFLYLHS
jgi:hypothetical protein